MRFYLGVDQGATKTAALVCDEAGNILGAATGPGLVTVYFNDENETYIKNIQAAAQAALDMAGLSFSDISAACGCLNGADWDFEYPLLQERLSRAVSCGDVVVLNDCIGGMRGGTASRECAVVCAGSGLNAAVRCIDGREIIYGYYVRSQDQGGGALGDMVFRRVMDASLGLEGETLLTQLVLAHTGYQTPEQLMIDCSMRKYPLQKKELTPCLTEAYRRGDGGACEIVDAFARSVSRYIVAGLRRFDMLERSVEVVFSGGVFKGSGALISQAVFERIRQSAPRVIAIDARYEPVCGAALTLLDRRYDMLIPPDVSAAFDRSATAHGLLRDIGAGAEGAR